MNKIKRQFGYIIVPEDGRYVVRRRGGWFVGSRKTIEEAIELVREDKVSRPAKLRRLAYDKANNPHSNLTRRVK